MNLKENIESIVYKLKDSDSRSKLNDYFNEDDLSIDVIGEELVNYLIKIVTNENIEEIEKILFDLDLHEFWNHVEEVLKNKVFAYNAAKNLRIMDMNIFLKVTKYVFEEFILYNNDDIQAIEDYTLEELTDMANVLNTIQLKYLTEFRKENALIEKIQESFGLEEDRIIAVLQLIKSNKEHLLEKFYIENLMRMRRDINKSMNRE